MAPLYALSARTVVVSSASEGGSADVLTLAGMLLLTAGLLYRRRVLGSA